MFSSREIYTGLTLFDNFNYFTDILDRWQVLCCNFDFEEDQQNYRDGLVESKIARD